MQVVLGIDAAWTETQPSGVALAAETSGGWELVAVESSYQRFHARAGYAAAPEIRPSGSFPVAAELLSSCHALCDRPPDLVAIDMPLSRTPIRSRRVSDDAVSRAYGSRKCGTHTPSEIRPGPMSDDLRKNFEEAGYALQTVAASSPGLIEVYPHPALVELAHANERLPYKAGKVRGYWPDLSPIQRRALLYDQWHRIIVMLDNEIRGVKTALPQLNPDASGIELKAFEDKLDAVVCAWIAICALTGRARPFGDDQSAIWIPRAGAADGGSRQDPDNKPDDTARTAWGS
jgi:predicted RNase H-like nuclease